MRDIVNDIVTTIENKNKLYGESILTHREFGIYVRMVDKFKRIQNIIDKYEEKYPKYTDEELDVINDALVDIIGYALLWLYYYYRQKVYIPTNPIIK